MAVAMRTNGLHHAISLGNIEAPSKESSALQYEKCYDSDDDNMGRHRLRTSSSSELYPKTSVYSKGDIREQYCLTDRQLNSIERPRRERFFGCLSRRSAPQSFLGVCVGRRAPSDENLVAYAPFYKYPRYQHHHQRDEKEQETDLESSYFRRQPASILSTAKMPDSTIGNRFSWTDSHATTSQEDPGCGNEQRVRCSLYPVQNLYQDVCIINPFNREQHLISKPANCLYGYATHSILPTVPQPPGPTTPRTKHVSFARSHTLTSFDDVNLGLRSSGRMKTAQSQERLIGGKKPIIASGSIYEPVHVLTNPSTTQLINDGTQMSATQHQNILQHPHMHGHQHGHGHAHQHHHGTPFHVHQIVPVYHQEIDTQAFDSRHNEMPDNFIGMGLGGISIPCPTRSLAPPSPEVVLIEKKFRNAMKTQATQTELRKDGNKHSTEASPQTFYKIKVVSQGAQTNGLINGKKLTKSLSEMPNDNTIKQHDGERAGCVLKTSLGDHDALHRTQSEEPPRSPKQIFAKSNHENQLNLMYYNPPAPPPAMQSIVRRNSRIPSVDSTQSYSLEDKIPPNSSVQSITTHSDIKCEELNPTFISYEDSSVNYEDSYGMSPFDYESNSLPRRACSYHRLDNDLYSHSLPRRDPIYSQETCRHITDCTELLGDTNITDFPRQHLLPPPRQYRKDNEDPFTFTTSHQLIEPPSIAGANRRMSMVVSMQNMNDTPFKRDDIRRQSMPVPTRTQKLSDGYVNLNSTDKIKPTFDSSDEKEIFIDFKPHISTIDTTKKQQKHRKVQKSVSDGEILTTAQHKKPEEDSVSNASVESSMVADAESECDEEEEEEEEEEKEDPLYENVQCYNMKASESDKRDRFRKRSISLEDTVTKKENVIAKSAPPSPCQDELLLNASTYPSSDSLANDLTRDHSDGIWNESQVTVLTADTRDINEPEYCTNLLLTPSSKRKNLILQHQQRSSIDTDALDLEDQFTDHSPTFSILSSKAPSTPTRNAVQAKSRDFNTTLSVPMSIATPIIAVTPTANTTQELELRTARKSPNNSRRSSKSLSPVMQDVRKMEHTPSQGFQHKNAENQNSGNYYVYFRSEAGKNNTDLSECSTNTDEYVTCTDTSKRTPGIKTPPTTTSSSSTTQVPVSAQSSQTEKTHGGSSFESASSLYSSRGDVIFDDITQVEEKLTKLKTQTESTLAEIVTQETKLSPAHSISSTSSGSYNMTGIKITSPSKTSKDAMAQTTTTSLLIITPPTKTAGVSSLERPTVAKKKESISDDERSDKRYSSSGYYESPHDEEHTVAGKFRRHRLEEDRKRRRTIMKLDIEKENIRALTSPIKKSEVQSVHSTNKEQSPEKQMLTNSLEATTSPSKMKRFRPKIRRQFRRSSRDGENTLRRQKNHVALLGLPTPANTEKLLDVSANETFPKSSEPDTIHGRISPTGRVQSCSPIEAPLKPLVCSTTPNNDAYQLKAKSVESLRSVSPGSDSVFYSEADGTTGNDPHSHCLHCGKEMEAAIANAAVGTGDSVESLPGIENDVEQDIVKPPSDFADSPVATKTTQRLYKKMDKRFRSEERYNTERGRHYKSRQENIRAKSEERGREKCTRSPQTLRPSGSSPCVLPDASNEQRNQIIYRGHYDHGRYSRLTDADVWMQLDHQSFDRQRDRRASTESEKSFHAKYQVILHRLVQRRCTLEMYHRQKNNNFSIDKTVVVKSDSGEFGFRIHGSKPVVVAAIEPDTPAESSGLEVGDIIISVNGVQVLDKHHTEVVKIAHAGCDTLELEVARTIGVLMNEQQEPPSKPIFSGYLWRQSGQAKGTPNTKKWVRRWFCLRPDHCLYYYKTEEDTQPVGAMIMAKHTVETCSQDIGKPFAFKIDSGEGIPMYVAADSEELAKQWMNTLKHSAAQADPWLEKCARTLHMPPSGILRPDCFGYLMKLGSRWCGWSKRYCVLKDACLYFYQDANSKNSFGMACLQGYKVASMSTNASGRKNSFEIIPIESKLRHYYFSTESEMDKKRWISALEYSIDRWIKSG